MEFDLFQAGNMLEAIFPPKLVQIFYDQLLKQQQDEATKQIGTNRGKTQTDLAAYDSEVKRAIGEIQKFNPEDQTLYGGMARTLAASDPTASYKDISNFDLGQFGKVADMFGDKSSLATNLIANKLGYGGGGDSTLGRTITAANTAKNLAPYLASVLGGTASKVSSLLSDRRADFGGSDAAIQARAGVPTRTLGLNLAPIFARNQAQSDDQSLIGQGIKNIRDVTAGFKEKKNKWAAFGQAADAGLNSAVNLIASMYTGGMLGGGGGIGGMAGGAAGGATGGGIGSMLGGMMGGGAGGGGNNQQLMQLLMQLIQGGGGRSGINQQSSYLGSNPLPYSGFDYGVGTGG